jgi:hypothetical protein
MRALRLLFLALSWACLFAGAARATTWDEPWHREVVSEATSFGLYEIARSTPGAVTLKRAKHIAGDRTPATIELKSFYALRLTSRSGDHGPEFRLPAGSKAYFYLKPADGAWAIATPTAGYAGVGQGGEVYATYRFSAHQAIADAPVYEMTQRCIFEVLHGRRDCDPSVAAFVTAQLARPAVTMAADRAVFFNQHIALETASFTHQPIAGAVLEGFLNTPDIHVQLSSLRALAAQRPDKAERLMRFVQDEHAEPTARAMAAMLLVETGAHGMKQRLLDYAPKADDAEAGLGIALMDPRIGTHFPRTLKQAVQLAGEQL